MYIQQRKLCPERISHQKRGAQKHFPRLAALRVDFSVKNYFVENIEKNTSNFYVAVNWSGLTRPVNKVKNAYMSTKGFF